MPDAPFALSVKGYPNPTQGGLTVQVMSRISGPVQMQVLDLTGRALQQRIEPLPEGLSEVKFDLSAQPTTSASFAPPTGRIARASCA